MIEVQFKRGLRRKYNSDLYKDCIFFATDTKEILCNNISYGAIDVDDVLTEIGQNPVTGSAIYKAIKDNISLSIDNAGFAKSLLVVNTGNNIYQILLFDNNGNLLSTSAEIVGDLSGSVELSGLKFYRIGNQYQLVKTGLKALLTFMFDVTDSSGSSLGTAGTVSLIKDTIDNEPIFTKDVTPGQSSIDVSEYLAEGEITNFWLVASVEGYETKTLYYTVRLVNLAITSNYAVNTVTTVGNTLSIPFSITGINGVKTTRAYLDGVEVASVDVSSVTSNLSINISTNGLSHGTHNVLLRADYNITDEYNNVTATVYSNIIYLDVIIIDGVSLEPVFSCRFDYENGEELISGTPVVNAMLYDLFNLDYFVYDPNPTREVEFYSEGKSVGSNTFADNYSSIKYRYTTLGTKICYFECNGAVYDFVVNVSKLADMVIDEPTSSLSLYLDALGKSNSSLSRDSWTYGDTTSTFEGFNWSGNGWTGESLKLFNGAKVTIHHQPFKSASSGALAFTIRFKVSNSANPDEILVSCVDKYGYGLTITALEAKLKTLTDEVSTKFATDLTYTIGFVSFPEANSNSSLYGINNSKMCYIYVDGIISGGVLKTNANEIYLIEPLDITILASLNELEIYSIRVYSTELADDLMFNCYLIDLVDSEKISEEYKLNDVLNLNGEITPEKVYGKIPYFIITGANEEGTMSLFEYAAIKNDKGPKYDVDSILYVDTNPEYNFICIPNELATEKNKPLIRLLGTSSMGYPRKNYRIYTKLGVIYLGCDENGEGGKKLSKPKYSLSATSAPVNCWCLKADFAESSSSHNTGTTGLVEEVLAKAELLTPALKYVNKETYPYQVRTTVEGKPCLMFFRKTVGDTPKFGGKFNFNNDKSTEDVFGFLDIPGYNDTYATEMAEAAKKSLIFPSNYTEELKLALLDELEGNPTECWEFLNNNTLMGQFLESDFDKIDPESGEGKYYWVTSWEARFPDLDNRNSSFDNGVKPYYLMSIAKWLHSTCADLATGELLKTPQYGFTNDTAEYRLAKFKNELSNYFDIDYLCAYYLFTDCLAAADLRVKNMMWGIWFNPDVDNHEIMGKMRCYPIFYDNDTILGIDNTGKIAINWDADENTVYGDGYAFAGHNSTIWNNLRSLFSSKLEEVYLLLRNLNMSNATMLKWYNSNQSDKYCEKVYNKDSIWKYIIPANVGVEVLEGETVRLIKYPFLALMLGSRRAHRSWFINNRMDMFDAKYQGGSYKSAEVTWKGPVIPGEGETISLSATTSRDYYLSLTEATNTKLFKKVGPEDTFFYESAEGITTSLGDVYHLYGIKWLKSLDLSNWGGYEYVTFTSVMPALERLILGGHRNSSETIAPLLIDNTMPSLKYLDITNIKISNLDLTGCIYLEELIATGSKLNAVSLAEGCNIKKLVLPSTFNYLSLIGLPLITSEGIQLESLDNILRLRIEKCDKLNGLLLLNNILSSDTNNLTYVRITDLNVSGNGQDLIKYKNFNLGGIDSNGGTIIGKCKLIGTYQLTLLLDSSVYEELCLYFDELVIKQPEYTLVSFDLSNSTPQKVTNYDNNTGFDFGNTYIPSGHILNILNLRHSYMVKSVDNGVAAMQLEDNSNKYIDKTNASFSGEEGDYCMYEPHYWYKGINDHMNRKIYIAFASKEPSPSIGDKISLDDCTRHTGYRVNASTSTSESDVLITLGTFNSYVAYSYVITKPYKLFRVNSVSNASTGCVVVDKNGNILKRMSADANKGMYNGSYLFGTLPEGAYKIYFTLDTNYTSPYYLYLTESADLVDIEPDWVEHLEIFVGRVMSTLYNGIVLSAIYSNANPMSTYYYPFNTTKVIDMCSELRGRSTDYTKYDAADYEVMKDIIVLSFVKYGGTDLQLSYVGAGADSSNNILFYPSYRPGGVDMTAYGTLDTKSSVDMYDSYYETETSKVYPRVATLMGYHLMIGLGSIASNNDIVNISSKVYSNARTGRTVLLDLSNTYIKFIIGGRYVDLFGTSAEGGTTNTGFCGRLKYDATSGVGLLEFGYRAYGQSYSPVTYSMNVTSSIDTSSVISSALLTRLLRVLIIPSLIKYYTNSTEFKSL